MVWCSNKVTSVLDNILAQVFLSGMDSMEAYAERACHIPPHPVCHSRPSMLVCNLPELWYILEGTYHAPFQPAVMQQHPTVPAANLGY